MNQSLYFMAANVINIIQDFNYLFSYQNSLAILALILSLIAWSPMKIYSMLKLYKKLDKGKALPSRINDFPVHNTSLEKYLNVKKKIDDFRDLILREEPSKISISADELNDLYLEGSSINKYTINLSASFIKYSNNFFFFEIFDNTIFRKEINYITSDGMDGIVTQTIEFLFEVTENDILCKEETVERNGKNVRGKDKYEILFRPLNASNFLESLLRGSFQPLTYQQIYGNEIQLTSKIIDKINFIEVSDGHITIEAS
jgi:hypothetical protein